MGLVMPKLFLKPEDWKVLSWKHKIRKFIDHFCTAFIGLVILYYLWSKLLFIIQENQYLDGFSIVDILLLFISILGIDGYLSYVGYSIAVNIKEIASKVSNYIKS